MTLKICSDNTSDFRNISLKLFLLYTIKKASIAQQ